MAGGDGGGDANRSLQETPIWALATVCFIFIFLGIFVEHLIHLAGHVSNYFIVLLYNFLILIKVMMILILTYINSGFVILVAQEA